MISKECDAGLHGACKLEGCECEHHDGLRSWSSDMFGNDLTATDSFGTPVAQKVWVGRVEGDRNAKVPFKTVGEAEHFIAQLEVLFPDEVRAGNFYIDAPEGSNV